MIYGGPDAEMQGYGTFAYGFGDETLIFSVTGDDVGAPTYTRFTSDLVSIGLLVIANAVDQRTIGTVTMRWNGTSILLTTT